jgi:hypothetical protein
VSLQIINTWSIVSIDDLAEYEEVEQNSSDIGASHDRVRGASAIDRVAKMSHDADAAKKTVAWTADLNKSGG